MMSKATLWKSHINHVYNAHNSNLWKTNLRGYGINDRIKTLTNNKLIMEWNKSIEVETQTGERELGTEEELEALEAKAEEAANQ